MLCYIILYISIYLCIYIYIEREIYMCRALLGGPGGVGDGGGGVEQEEHLHGRLDPSYMRHVSVWLETRLAGNTLNIIIIA